MERAIAPDDPRHGTTRGYHAGCRDDCCRRAINAAAKRGRIERQLGHYRRVPAIGTRRRLQALACMGWSQREVLRRAGYGRGFIDHINRSTWLNKPTAAKFARLYDELSGTVGPSTWSRTYAQQAGWAPPIAWDDDTIDDPDAQPWRDEIATHAARRAAVIEDTRELLSWGVPPDEIAERCGYGDVNHLYTALRRAGERELVAELIKRNTRAA